MLVPAAVDADGNDVSPNRLTPSEEDYLAETSRKIAATSAVTGGRTHGFDARGFLQLLLASANSSEQEGQLDEAWKRYRAAFSLIHYLDQDVGFNEYREIRSHEFDVLQKVIAWSGRAGQTPDRLKGAIQELARLENTAGRPQACVARDYLLTQAALDGNADAIEIVQNEGQLKLWPKWLWRILFWERFRAKRVINELAASNMNDLAMLDDLIDRGVAAMPWVWMGNFPPYVPGQSGDGPLDEARFSRFITQSDSGSPGVDDILLHLKLAHLNATARVAATPMIERYYDGNTYSYGLLHLSAVMRFRATQTLLGIQVWKLEHDGLPKVLEELVGPVFATLPLDPFTGKPFHYSPEPLVFTVPERYLPDSEDKPEAERLVPLPARAFIWSLGHEVVINQLGDASEKRQREILKSTWFEVPASD